MRYVPSGLVSALTAEPPGRTTMTARHVHTFTSERDVGPR